jgi:hypothetical protein
MNAKRKTWLALGLALAGWTSGAAEAANPSRLNINVSITQNLSVSVNNAVTSTQTVNWNTATPNDRLVSPSTNTVLNDSGGQTERWQLSTQGSISNSGVDNWTIAASSTAVGANQFALQAVFGSSNTAAGGCPAFNSAEWDTDTADLVSAGLQTYDNTRFVAGTLTAGGGTPNPDTPASGRMQANSRRALCWRVITPSTSDTTETQNIQLYVTAIAP